MKRTTKVSASDEHGEIEVTIRVSGAGLTKHEADLVTQRVTEGVKLTVTGAPFITVPLSKVKVGQ